MTNNIWLWLKIALYQQVGWLFGPINLLGYSHIEPVYLPLNGSVIEIYFGFCTSVLVEMIIPD